MPPAGKKGSDKKPAGHQTPLNKNWEAGLVKAQFEEVCRFDFFFFKCCLLLYFYYYSECFVLACYFLS